MLVDEHKSMMKKTDDEFLTITKTKSSNRGGSRGGGGGVCPPKITLKCDKAQATLRNSSKSMELYIAQKG